MVNEGYSGASRHYASVNMTPHFVRSSMCYKEGPSSFNISKGIFQLKTDYIFVSAAKHTIFYHILGR